jgi:hypothetical protein
MLILLILCTLAGVIAGGLLIGGLLYVTIMRSFGW